MKSVSLLLFCVLLLGGCTSVDKESAAGCEELKISLPATELNLRVASLSTGTGSVIAALGASESLVGSDLGSNTGAEVLNPMHSVNIERLLELRPDVVFVDSTEADDAALAAIDAVGARRVTLDPVNTLEGAFRRIEIVASELGVAERAGGLKTLISNELDDLDTAKLAGKRVAFLYLRGSAGIYLLAGDGSGADEIIEALGAVDVGSSQKIKGFAPITSEKLLEADPEYLMVMQKGLESVGGIDGLLRMPGVSGTSAAQQRAVLVGADDELLSFGPQTPGVLACLISQVQ